ncbi:MAG: DUF348 domain-containing protein [Clostridia bacterium]|nr:DUF348 domain-containing protein [Clostridia bacterium]
MKQFTSLFTKLTFVKSIPFRSVLVALSTLLILSAVSFTLIGFVVAKDITIVDGELQTTVTTTRFYVEELLAEQGISLRSGDRISAPLNSVLRQDDRIVIQRGRAIYLTVDGNSQYIYSCADTLAEALEENAISLGEQDTIEPALDTAVTSGMQVQIERLKVFEQTVTEILPRHVVVKPNSEQNSSYSKVITEGSDGSATTTYRIVVRGGKEESREVLAQTVHQAPVDQVIEKGILGSKSVVTSTEDLEVKEVLEFQATAYTALPCCNGSYAGMTASGRKPAYGVVAVDPRVIPLGTKLYIESLDGSWAYGFAVAGDTGGAIKGHKIDLFMETHAECNNFGRRQVRVYVLE